MTVDKPLWMQNDVYPASLDRLLIAQQWDEGVMDRSALKVTQRAAGANFSVDIAAGEAVVTGDDQTRQGNYLIRVTAAENLALSAAPGSNSRYDLIILQLNDPNAGGAAGDNATITKVTGTASATPAVPALPNSAIPLAIVGPISSATGSITTSLIHDAFSGTGPAGATTTRMLAGRRCTPATMELRADGNVAAINGWLYCDGSAVSRSTYARLFAHIGTTYGSGNGSTTFNIPDLRDRVPVASGATFPSFGGTGGEVNHQLTTAEMPAHSHVVASHAHGGATGTESVTHVHTVPGQNMTTSSAGAHTHEPSNLGDFIATGGGTSAGVGTGTGFAQVPTTTSDGAHTHVTTFQAENTLTESAFHTHAIAAEAPVTSSVGSGTVFNNMQPFMVIAGWAIRT